MLELLNQVSDPRIRMDIVFAPLLTGDSLNAANTYMPVNPDPRARVWWDATKVLSHGLPPFFLGVAPVIWDIYMIYDTDVLWGVNGTDTPGLPAYYEHQLTSLSQDLFLDPDRFLLEVVKRLPDCDEVVTE
jgi:hypothetical protein